MTKKELEKENKRLRTFIKLLTDELEYLRTFIKLLTDELEYLRKIYRSNTGYESCEYEPDLSKCPRCGGPADNGYDRCIPPNPYVCTKCSTEI